MKEYILYFAENFLELNSEELENKKKILEYLKDNGQIELQKNFIIFKNYTGIFEANNKIYLIIPKKLAEQFDLIDKNNNPLEELANKYNEKFLNFLKFILKELAKEQIIYSLSLAHFPVEESKLNRSSIFKLLLLLNKKDELVGAFHIILSNPYKELVRLEDYKNFDEVSYIDFDVIIDIAQNPERLYQTQNGIITYENKKYSPLLVLQYEIEETFDAFENRFVKYFLKELEQILLDELKDFLFLEELQEIKNELENILQSDIFSNVSDLNYFPSNSQVLIKKSGYREVFQIYRLLHLSFTPKIFEDLDMAFSLKNMAILWEYYVLIEILKEFKEEFNNYKIEIDFEEKSKYKTEYEEARFKFNNELTLFFQKTKKSYANIEFRPDFLIEFNGKKYVFDAKFRTFEGSRADILKNMHYYKDGLKLTSAIAVCLGNSKEGTFWTIINKDDEINSFKNIIDNESFEGIGHIDLNLEIK